MVQNLPHANLYVWFYCFLIIAFFNYSESTPLKLLCIHTLLLGLIFAPTLPHYQKKNPFSITFTKSQFIGQSSLQSLQRSHSAASISGKVPKNGTASFPQTPNMGFYDMSESAYLSYFQCEVQIPKKNVLNCNQIEEALRMC